MIWLAVIGIMLSLIGVYYYLKVIVFMWFFDAVDEVSAEVSVVPATAAFATVLAVAGTLAFGFVPDLFFKLFKFIS